MAQNISQPSPTSRDVLPLSLPGRYSVYLDFETRSECDIRQHGAWRYAKHSSTEVLCLEYKIADGPVKRWVRGDKLPADLKKCIADGWLIEAHNYFFEKCIWTHIMVPQFGWPAIPAENWRCTAALASRHNLPRSLDGACRALNLPVQKDKAGHALMLKMCKPRRATKNNDAKWHESKEDLARLYKYCRQDVDAGYALSQALPPLDKRELAIWQFTEALNWRGVQLDLDFAARAMKIFKAIDEDGKKLAKSVSNGTITTLSQVARILDFCAKNGVILPNLQRETVAEILTTELPEPVRTLLEARQSLSKAASISKYKAMLARADADDERLRDHVRYFGAGPGRWAGQGVQTQNLPSRGISPYSRSLEIINLSKIFRRPAVMRHMYPAITKELSSAVRPAFIAAPGKVFVCADYNAIEARVLAWLTDDPNLEIFKRNEDVYIEMASKIYERKITEEDKAERALGKEAELACGYQLWWKTLLVRCWQRGVKIDPKLALRTVKLYRDSHPRVRKFWDDINAAFIECIISNDTTRVSKLRFEKVGRNVHMIFPSGRYVVYNNASVKLKRRKAANHKKLETALKQLGADSKTIETAVGMHNEETASTGLMERQVACYWREDTTSRKWVETSTYGGKLTENACQGLAGDVLATASLQLAAQPERFGQAVLTVHDELVMEADELGADLDGMIETMCSVPGFDGLPLAGAGWVGKRYRK